MASKTELAKAYVEIIPSATGIGGKISEALGGEVTAAGATAGQSLGKSLIGAVGKLLAAAGRAQQGIQHRGRAVAAMLGVFGLAPHQQLQTVSHGTKQQRVGCYRGMVQRHAGAACLPQAPGQGGRQRQPQGAPVQYMVGFRHVAQQLVRGQRCHPGQGQEFFPAL